MKSNIEHKIYSNTDANIDQLRLFQAFAQSLKLPINQMARAAELSQQTGNTDDLTNLAVAADSLNYLIDSYALSLQLKSTDGMFLEPVSLAAVLSDTAHALEKQAAKYGCDVELDLAGRYGPVLAHPSGLQAALMNIGLALIDATAQQQKAKRPVITLATHRTSHGVVAGMFSDVDGLDKKSFRIATKLYGSAKQPLTQLTSRPAAEIFVASSLLSSMSGGLRVARFHKHNGLAATFSPSQQMSLV